MDIFNMNSLQESSRIRKKLERKKSDWKRRRKQIFICENQEIQERKEKKKKKKEKRKFRISTQEIEGIDPKEIRVMKIMEIITVTKTRGSVIEPSRASQKKLKARAAT